LDNFSAHELSIDKNGLWYADGLLMVRKKIIKMFASHLEKEGPENYHINWKNQLYPVKVEDAPFWAQSITEQAGRLMIRLYDGRAFPLPQGNIIMRNEVPYISLFWQCDTKLSQHAYWELCEYAIERGGHYFIKYGDNEWRVEDTV